MIGKVTWQLNSSSTRQWSNTAEKVLWSCRQLRNSSTSSLAPHPPRCLPTPPWSQHQPEKKDGERKIQHVFRVGWIVYPFQTVVNDVKEWPRRDKGVERSFEPRPVKSLDPSSKHFTTIYPFLPLSPIGCRPVKSLGHSPSPPFKLFTITDAHRLP